MQINSLKCPRYRPPEIIQLSVKNACGWYRIPTTGRICQVIQCNYPHHKGWIKLNYEHNLILAMPHERVK